MGRRAGRKKTRRLKIANNPVHRTPRVVAMGHRRPNRATVSRIDTDAFIEAKSMVTGLNSRVVTIIRRPATKGGSHDQIRQSAV